MFHFEITVMLCTYFILFSDHLQYPIYVAFDCVMSVTAFRKNKAAWSVIYHVTCMRQKFFFIEECSYDAFQQGIVKFDFTC